MLSTFKRFWSEDSGQGLTEYALIIALVSVGLVAIMILFRESIGGVFASITGTLQAAPNP
jgi:pilus assembly protein Flp/PilA